MNNAVLLDDVLNDDAFDCCTFFTLLILFNDGRKDDGANESTSDSDWSNNADAICIFIVLYWLLSFLKLVDVLKTQAHGCQDGLFGWKGEKVRLVEGK